MTLMVEGANGTQVAARYRPNSDVSTGIVTSNVVTVSSTPQAITLPIPVRPPRDPTTGSQPIYPVYFA